MENFQIEKLKKENALLQKKLELAGAIAGRAKNINHVLALAEGDIRGGAFYFRGESGLSASEYVARIEQHPDYAHLFGGGNGGTGTKENNPFKRGPSFNLTKQMEIMKKDPSLAAELKKQARG